MNATFLRLELIRIIREPVSLFFIIALPAFMYVIFGASTEWGDYPIQNGNVSMSIMIAMAAYGAVTATTGVGANAAVERMQGWGRQLAITPMTDLTFVVTKALTAMLVAAAPVVVIYGLGLTLGAEAPTPVWFASLAIVLVGSAMFALYGLMFGLAFRSEGSVSIASASLVIFGFLGNMFMPLSGLMLTIAKFTPLYGYAALARYPLTGGETIDLTLGTTIHEPLWQLITNVVAWTLVFLVISLLVVRRGRARQ